MRGTKHLHSALFASPCGAVSPAMQMLDKWAHTHKLVAAIVEDGPAGDSLCKVRQLHGSPSQESGGPMWDPFHDKGAHLRAPGTGRTPGPLQPAEGGTNMASSSWDNGL